MRHLSWIVVVAALLGAACGGTDAGSLGRVSVKEPSPRPTSTKSSTPGASPTPTGGPTAQPTTGDSGSGQTITYEVWFTYGESLFVTKRTQGSTQAVGAASLEALIEGPTAAERAAGIGSQVPTATDLLGLAISDGVATVDMSSSFESGGGSLSEQMRVAQVVYTLTQFPTVSRVRFEIDGRPVQAISGEGIVVDPPPSRQSFADLLPAILVSSPSVGARVANPVTVSGTANVFEATVSIRILDASGHEIARTFTTATCGTGCRGNYSAAVSYRVSSEQRGTIEVFESSAKDGSATNVVRIPVTLTP